MAYNKPEIVKVDNALNSTKGTKTSNVLVDSNPHHTRNTTIGAYEADE